MNQAKKEAQRLFNEYYMILFCSDTDKGEECTVSILSIQCAEFHIKDKIQEAGFKKERVKFLNEVLKELHNL